ncbi:MAG TPA: hypothetical protein IAB31_07145 [Candidatus Choladousia intestinavium]|uniref:Uncharacterized protein n=1 Tax=Candidatus Choladousia intestinavium TaxID=2840727 RepID=A0A9D1D9A9_9FIRM|nr:hypothetical protein [Candidatus Choladousia intestinavium]
MSDLYDAWEQEDFRTSPEQDVRRDTVFDAVKRMLWKTLAVQETKKEVFTLREARELFDRMLARRPIEEQMEDTCALSVERENGGYLIKLILMDKNRNFVRMTTKSYYGYVLTAKHIDEMLGRYMNGQTVRILPNPNR